MAKIENIFENIHSEVLKKGITLELIKENDYLINQNDLDSFLQIVSFYCSSNQVCFTLFNNNYGYTKILFFEIGFVKPLEYNLYTIQPNLIKKEDQTAYSLQVKKLKKRKIFPVIGPDGVGKTTLLQSSIEQIKNKVVYQRFKKIVRRSVVYNIIHPITKHILKYKLKQKPQKDQHDDTYYFLIYLCGLIYYPVLLYKSMVKKRVVFLDRFFDDYLLKNISFGDRKTILRENWKFMLKLTPKSYWKIHLDAKEEIILSRKDELSPDDIKQYRELNFDIYNEKKSVVYTYINTGLELEHCQKVFLYSGTCAKVLKLKSGEFKS